MQGTCRWEKSSKIPQWTCAHSFKIEKVLHKKFHHYRTDEYGGKVLIGEWFNLTKEEIDSFLLLCESAHKSFSYLEESDNPFF